MPNKTCHKQIRYSQMLQWLKKHKARALLQVPDEGMSEPAAVEIIALLRPLFSVRPTQKDDQHVVWANFVTFMNHVEGKKM